MGIDVDAEQVVRVELSDDRFEELALPVPFARRDREHFTRETQRVELARGGLELRRLALVSRDHDRLTGLEQPSADRLVEGRHAGAGVHQEQDQVGVVDREIDLDIDVSIEGVAGPAEPAHVADFDRASVLDRNDRREPIAGRARGRLFDREPLTHKAIEEGRLAHVRATHDRHEGIATSSHLWGVGLELSSLLLAALHGELPRGIGGAAHQDWARILSAGPRQPPLAASLLAGVSEGTSRGGGSWAKRLPGGQPEPP